MRREKPAASDPPAAPGRALRALGVLLSGRLVVAVLSPLVASAGVLAASLSVALTPAIALCWVAWLLDRHEREPLRRIGGAFLWGAFPAVVFAGVFNDLFGALLLLVMSGEVDGNFGTAVLVAPVVEELLKGAGVVFIATVYRKEFDGVLDGLLYASVIGFGFGVVEDVLYMLRAFESGGWEVWGATGFARSVVFVTGHALFTSCLGAALGAVRYSQSAAARRWVPLAGLAAAIVLHMVFNFLAGREGGLVWMFALIVVGNACWLGVVALAARQEARWIREELLVEVDARVLSREQAEAASSWRARLRALRRARRRGDARRRQLGELLESAVELALSRRKERLVGADLTGRCAADHRETCRELSRELAVSDARG